MNVADFTGSTSGKLRKQTGGYYAFLPAPLPPELKPSWEMFSILDDASRSLSELSGLARNLPNPHLLIEPFMRKEAVLSSKIEGTQATLSDLLVFEASRETVVQRPDVKEVSNYVQALQYGLLRLTDLPLSTRLLRELHARLIDDPTKTPGELRTSQNWIGAPGCTMVEATYVPPPPGEELMSALSSLERFIHEPGELPPLIRYAAVHYQFEAIHPFLDGNGRLGRLLITLLLCTDPVIKQPLLTEPLLYLSVYFEQNREEYYRRLLAVSQRGEWDAWFRFFLIGVIRQAKDALDKSSQLLALLDTYRERVRGSALAQQITEHLFVSPVVTVSEVAKRFGKTYQGANHAIERLVTLGILEAVPGKQRNRLFAARGIIQAIEQ